MEAEEADNKAFTTRIDATKDSQKAAKLSSIMARISLNKKKVTVEG